MTTSRRDVLRLGGATVLLAALTTGSSAQGGRIGVVLLHGKQSDASAALGSVSSQVTAATGAAVAAPDLPWSGSRYLSGTWSQAMGEIGGAVASVRAQGAGRVVLVGHSMGCPAAMSYAAARGSVAGLALTSPGHNPRGYYRFDPGMRESIDRARAMVKSGRSGETATFFDNNQGNVFPVQTTAGQYMSYFDPSGPCEMSNTAGRVGCPVLWVVGTNDRVIEWGDPIARRLTGRPKSRYLVVPGAGHGNAPSIAAAEVARWIASI